MGPKSTICPDLYINKWKLKSVDETTCEVRNLIDVEDGEHLMEDSEEEKYLGFILTRNGTNERNVAARRSKGLSAVNEICSIINDNCFGPYTFEVLTTLNNALLINRILSHSSMV